MVSHKGIVLASAYFLLLGFSDHFGILDYLVLHIADCVVYFLVPKLGAWFHVGIGPENAEPGFHEGALSEFLHQFIRVHIKWNTNYKSVRIASHQDIYCALVYLGDRCSFC